MKSQMVDADLVGGRARRLCQHGAHRTDGAIALKSVRGYHVGGERKTLSGLPIKEVRTNPQAPIRKSDPNGDYQVGQLYVQHFALASPKAKVPLLLWHGGGLTGVTWETTPDGRAGWHEYFMRAGYDTFVSDAVERGRASWARYPEINPGEPEHRTIDQAWDIFRFGPAGGYSADVGKQNSLSRHAVPGGGDRPVHQAVRRPLDHQRCVDPERLRRAGAAGLPVRDRRAQPGRPVRVHGGAARARQGEGGRAGRAGVRPRSRARSIPPGSGTYRI